MTDRVDFYVLKSSTPKQRWIFACRLTEKAYLRDLRVVILSEAEAEAKALDDLLWTFNDRSFVPHQYCRDEHSIDSATPVHVTAAPEAAGTADLLVNLSDRLPSRLERFTRIAEIIDADPERRRLGRERFKAYRDQKLTLETHQLDDSADI
jgi:DNA polymerase III subunit chi